MPKNYLLDMEKQMFVKAKPKNRVSDPSTVKFKKEKLDHERQVIQHHMEEEKKRIINKQISYLMHLFSPRDF